MDKEEAFNELCNLVSEGNEVLSTKWEYYVDIDVFSSWRIKSMSFLKLFLPETHDFVKVFKKKRIMIMKMQQSVFKHWRT